MSVIHSFSGRDGNRPYGLIMDSGGNLYGAAWNGGTSGVPGNGVVYKLTPSTNGTWAETVLHSFTGGPDGQNPRYLTMDSAGNLYGTTFTGGQEGPLTVIAMGAAWYTNSSQTLLALGEKQCCIAF